MDTDPDETICKEKLEQANLMPDPRMKEERGWCFLEPPGPCRAGPSEPATWAFGNCEEEGLSLLPGFCKAGESKRLGYGLLRCRATSQAGLSLLW